MTQIAYGMKTRTPEDGKVTERRLREALAEEGFGVLTEIDVAATLRDKLGIEVAPNRILGACNPTLAAQALDLERDIGLLLPCNITVYEDGEGTVVSVLDPRTMVDLTHNAALGPVATEARIRLERVIAVISTDEEEDADA